MKKSAQVVMLPTNEKAVIGFLTQKGKERGHLVHFDRPMPNILDSENQHLYFLSDEEIKEGDWYINTWGDGLPMLCQVNSKEEADDCNRLKHCCKKIIATTDKSLVITKDLGEISREDILPQPSQSFIEKFVEEYNKGNIIKEVMVEYEISNTVYANGKTVFPLTESMVVYNPKINPKDNTITIRKVKDSWNRQEMIQVVYRALGNLKHLTLMKDSDKVDKWIDENL